MKIDLTAMQTEEWIAALRDLALTMAAVCDERAQDEERQIKARAAEEGWEYPEYLDAMDGSYSRYRYWLPMLSAYSLVILLHSLLETQLFSYASRVRKSRNLTLGHRDLKGEGISQAHAYLTKVAGIDFGNDPGWQLANDLKSLRNVVVHRRGHQGTDPKHREEVSRLVARYPGLRLEGSLVEGEEQIKVSLQFCLECLDATKGLLDRVAVAGGFPTKGWV